MRIIEKCDYFPKNIDHSAAFFRKTCILLLYKSRVLSFWSTMWISPLKQTVPLSPVTCRLRNTDDSAPFTPVCVSMETVNQEAAGLQGEDKSNTFRNSMACYVEQVLLIMSRSSIF